MTPKSSWEESRCSWVKASELPAQKVPREVEGARVQVGGVNTGLRTLEGRESSGGIITIARVYVWITPGIMYICM